jgi:hypothetical protein
LQIKKTQSLENENRLTIILIIKQLICGPTRT